MNANPETERRRHRRLELTNLVAYKSFGIEEVTETINISLGGMQIRTEFALEKDENLDVSLRIGEEEFKSRARVMYCNSRNDQAYEVGLKFEGTSRRYRTLLDQYLSNQTQIA